MSERILYHGETAMTRGDCGENVVLGRLQDGCIYVWDSTYGWSLWSILPSEYSGEWERTGEILPDITPDW